MKLTDASLINALQSQWNFERFSADVYYSLSAQLDALNLTGFKAYMLKRSNEERTHAQKFADYLADRDVVPVMEAIPAPDKTLDQNDPMGAGMKAFGMALLHEQLVTERLTSLYENAESSDSQTTIWLQWFLLEQIEEERTIEEILTKFRLAMGNGAAILALNKDLANE